MNMKGLKLHDEIESKDEESQMYLENNLNKIKNNFFDIYDKHQRLFRNIADEVKNSIDYEMLSSEVADINFYGKYGTLYEYLYHLLEFGVEQKSFLENLSKGFKFKRRILPLKGK